VVITLAVASVLQRKTSNGKSGDSALRSIDQEHGTEAVRPREQRDGRELRSKPLASRRVSA